MKKYLLIIISFLFVATSSVAFAENNFYVGIGATTGSGELKESVTITDLGNFDGTTDYDTTSTVAKIGYILNDNHRFEFSVESGEMEVDGGGSADLSGWNIDWVIVLYKDTLSPFLTLGTGYYTFDADVMKMSGAALNYGGGVLYSLNDNIEIEASYRWKTLKWVDAEVDILDVSVESTQSALYAGLNYKF